MNSNRRHFLKTLAASSAALALNPRAALLGSATTEIEKHPTPGSLDFVFFTDTHIQPELDAAHGCALAFQKIAALKPEFAIHGDRKSTRLNSSHDDISYAVFCL